MNIKEKIMQQEVELAKIVAIETIRENLDMTVGKVIEDLSELDTDRYHAAMVSLTFREILAHLRPEESAIFEDQNEEPAGQLIEADFANSNAKPRKVSKKKNKAASKSEANPAVKKEKKKAPPRKVQGPILRTSEFDNKVLEALAKFDKASMQDIRDSVGGSPAKVRAALNRLIESGAAGFEGKTRSTRYFQS
jgi:hypothetical protein